MHFISWRLSEHPRSPDKKYTGHYTNQNTQQSNSIHIRYSYMSMCYMCQVGVPWVSTRVLFPIPSPPYHELHFP